MATAGCKIVELQATGSICAYRRSKIWFPRACIPRRYVSEGWHAGIKPLGGVSWCGTIAHLVKLHFLAHLLSGGVFVETRDRKTMVVQLEVPHVSVDPAVIDSRRPSCKKENTASEL